MRNNTDDQAIRDSNQSAIDCLKWLQLGCIATLVLNELNIFVLEKMSVRIGCIAAMLIMAVPQHLKRFAGTDMKGLKYVTIAAVMLSAFLMNPVVGYASQLLYACPLMLSIQYTDKKFSLAVYFLTLLLILAGECFSWRIGAAEYDMVLEVLRLNILPNWIMITCILPFCLKVNAFRGQTERRTAELQSLADHDPMTGLYSKHKYEMMLESVYKKQSTIGLVYFDINELKLTNDKLGHNAGDQLILKAASSFKHFLSRTIYTYRMGGDEFMTVLTHCSEADVKRYISEWKLALDLENNVAGTILCKVSFGYSYGAGADIEQLIMEADMNMYDMKQRLKRK